MRLGLVITKFIFPSYKLWRFKHCHSYPFISIESRHQNSSTGKSLSSNRLYERRNEFCENQNMQQLVLTSLITILLLTSYILIICTSYINVVYYSHSYIITYYIHLYKQYYILLNYKHNTYNKLKMHTIYTTYNTYIHQ